MAKKRQAKATSQAFQERKCVAIIGDVVRSRTWRGDERRQMQRELKALLDRWNAQYVDQILARFLTTIGDEFQGLLRTAEPTLEMIRSLEYELPHLEFRVGVGHGCLETDLLETAIGMDGSVWHAARSALEAAKRNDLRGGVFEGFNMERACNDPILNGLARLLWAQYVDMKELQRQIVEVYKSTKRQQTKGSQAETAAQVQRAPQQISNTLTAICWNAVEEGESAAEALLRQFDYRTTWKGA